ncbi:hypothetical protein, partial [uncultured Ruegeria sp.]|uniref:hypothetical protein n=1 Tax=uncultured Ruegeria sp. TaxID=259304 RepID=UPI002604E8D2
PMGQGNGPLAVTSTPAPHPRFSPARMGADDKRSGADPDGVVRLNFSEFGRDPRAGAWEEPGFSRYLLEAHKKRYVSRALARVSLCAFPLDRI